jgi:hypothetical protein
VIGYIPSLNFCLHAHAKNIYKKKKKEKKKEEEYEAS